MSRQVMLTFTVPDVGTIHPLKTWPEYFSSVADGSKPFEVRKNDRDFKVGDTLHLLEYKPDFKYKDWGYTGRGVLRQISYILEAENLPGLQTGFVVLGLQIPEYL